MIKKRKNIIILLIIFQLFLGCNNTKCHFRNSFQNKVNYTEVKPSLNLITTNCKDFVLKGKINYHFEEYKINLTLYKKDNILYNDKNQIIFDFQTNKIGFLYLNEKDSIKIKHLGYVKDEFGNEFSLFELLDINNYFGEQISLVIICSLKYGIVGDFLSDASNKFQFNYSGYLGVKPAIDRLFIEKQLL